MFWTQFKKLCVEAGKSPNAVAAELQIPSGSITAWSKGAQPREKTIRKIAEYFGVSVGFFLADEADGQIKKSAPVVSDEGKLDEEVIMRLTRLTPDELEKVDAFVQGLLAAR